MKRTVSISEMADYCQVTAETIRRWIDSGAIPAKRTLGGHRRIDYKDFLRFLEQHNLAFERGTIGEKRRILVVSSDSEHREAIKASIQGVIKEPLIEAAIDGFEAGHKLASFHPDFIFFHTDTTGLDLIKAVKLIREDAGARSAKVVAVAGTKSKKQGSLKKIAELDFVMEDSKDVDTIKTILGV